MFNSSPSLFTFLPIFARYFTSVVGRHSSVGIATELRGWTVQGSNPAGGEIFCTCPDRPWAHPASCSMGTGSFPGVKSGRGGTLTPHPLLLPWSRKSTAIPLLPLWAVLPVQSLSACTTVHFTFTYTSTPPMGCTACTEPQCLYMWALLTLRRYSII